MGDLCQLYRYREEKESLGMVVAKDTIFTDTHLAID
jgi:hypothetical protein